MRQTLRVRGEIIRYLPIGSRINITRIGVGKRPWAMKAKVLNLIRQLEFGRKGRAARLQIFFMKKAGI